jgi:hypothetical protein
MSEPLPPAYKPPTRELASRIYVDLLSRNVTLADNSVKMSVSAENLAKLSFRLADAFQDVENELNAANLPKNPNFKLGVDDIAAWTK